MMLEEQHLDPLTGMNEMEEDEMAMAGGGAINGSGSNGANGAAAAQPARSRQAAPTLDPDNPATWGKVPRNSACPCGSGKKYKHCHAN